MAKQSVSFVERHVEKIVIGVAAAVILAMFVLFVLGAPHNKETNGESVGPGGIGAKAKEMADQLQNAMKTRKPDDPPITPLAPLVAQKSPFQLDKDLLKRVPIALAPLNVRPPGKIEGTKVGKVRLAKILAPGKPVVFQGRNVGTIPPTNKINLSGAAETPPSGDNTTVAAKDVTWVTVAAPILRKDQRELFIEAEYSPSLMGVNITRVLVQRQRLLPDGAWSEPEPATTYLATAIPIAPKIILAQDADGWGIDLQSDQQLNQFFNLVSSKELQKTVWRPPLASYLKTTEWVPPAIPEVTWQDWLGTGTPGGGAPAPAAEPAPGGPVERERPPARTTPEPAPRRGAGGDLERPAKRAAPVRPQKPAREGPPSDRITPDKANKDLAEAERQHKAGNLQGALDLVTPLLRETTLTATVKKKAEELATKLETELAAEQKRRAALESSAEPDIEPLWAHDMPAPNLFGQTFRYRIQYQVYNSYAGKTMQLDNVEDAKLAEIASEWSEWSEPITIRPDTYVFFTRASASDRTAGLEVFKWAGGSWLQFTPKVEVGDRIVINDKRTGLVDTQLTIMDVEVGVKRGVKSRPGRGGSFQIEEKPVDVLVLADANGMVQERVADEDRRSPEREAIREEMRKAREAASPGGGAK